MNYGKYKNEKDKYLWLKRVLAFLASIMLWGVSVFFSYKGFEFESTTILWFGIILALVVTVVELVFNTKISKLNPTLLFSGLICYGYGAYTNITGFYILQHGNLSNFFSGTNWFIPIFAGLVCEILPEGLFAWSLGSYDEGDLIGNIQDMFSDEKNSTTPKTYTPSQTSLYKNQPTSSVREFLRKQTDTKQEKIR